MENKDPVEETKQPEGEKTEEAPVEAKETEETTKDVEPEPVSNASIDATETVEEKPTQNGETEPVTPEITTEKEETEKTHEEIEEKALENSTPDSPSKSEPDSPSKSERTTRGTKRKISENEKSETTEATTEVKDSEISETAEQKENSKENVSENIDSKTSTEPTSELKNGQEDKVDKDSEMRDDPSMKISDGDIMGKGKRARIPNKRYSDILLTPNRKSAHSRSNESLDHSEVTIKIEPLDTTPVVSAVSSPSLPPPKKQRNTNQPKENLQDPKFLKPFKYGWKRELVWRSTSTSAKPVGDIYYYAPSGKKLRSFREVADFLPGANRNLTVENFSFTKEPLGIDDPEKEIIRDAKVAKSSESITDSPAAKKIELIRKPKKLLSPKSGGADTPKSPKPDTRNKTDTPVGKNAVSKSSAASLNKSTPASANKALASTNKSTPASANKSTPASANKSTPASANKSTPASASKGTPASASKSNVVSANKNTSASANKSSPAAKSTPVGLGKKKKMPLRKSQTPVAKKPKLSIKAEESPEVKSPPPRGSPAKSTRSAAQNSVNKKAAPAPAPKQRNLKLGSITNANNVAAKEKNETKFMENYLQNLSFGYNTLLYVFQYLKVQDLLRAGCVCTMWRDIASHPILWRTVRMKNSQVHSFEGLANTLKKHGTVHLDLRKMLLPSNGDEIWPEFSRTISRVDTLKKIELCRCPASVVEQLAESNPTLEVINAVTIKCESMNLDPIKSLTHIRELRLKSTSGLNIPSIDSIKELKTLKILSLTSVNDLHSLNLNVIAELTNLESLDLGECSDFPKNFGQDILVKLENLEKLRLEKGQGNCHTFEILDAVKDMKKLEQLELVNFDVKAGFDKALGSCKNIKKLMIIPTYISQSATTNNMVLSGVLRLQGNLSHFVWGVTLELLRVTELFVDQCEEPKEKREKKPAGNGDSIPVLKPVPDLSNGEVIQETINPPQVEILPLPNLQKLLLNSLPTTRVKILKIPFHATWRQTLTDSV